MVLALALLLLSGPGIPGAPPSVIPAHDAQALSLVEVDAASPHNGEAALPQIDEAHEKGLLPSGPTARTERTSGEAPLVVAVPVRSSSAVPPVAVPSKTQLPSKRAWFALVLVEHGAATFDAWSTRESIESNKGYERNPLLKPFAGSAAVYGAVQILPIGLDYVSRRMMRSKSFTRKWWWVPQAAASVGFVWCGVRNMHIAGR